MWFYPILFLGLGAFFSWGAWRVRRVRRRLLRSFAGIVLPLVACLFLFLGSYSTWYFHRPHPAPLTRTLFEGVVYQRMTSTDPRPNVIHVVTIDLDAPGLSFLVTPPDASDQGDLRARTTSQFLSEQKAQLAINGSFFQPWHSNGPFDYYPHVGDPVHVLGWAASDGRVYGAAERDFQTLNITRDNKAVIAPKVKGLHNALSGRVLLRDGAPPPSLNGDSPDADLHPRTALALDAAARKLILVVVDGRQPNWSEGVSLPELAEIVRHYGGHQALNLDGGGSTTLAAEDNGAARVLNMPVHGTLPPGRERPVANHLAVFVRPLP